MLILELFGVGSTVSPAGEVCEKNEVSEKKALIHQNLQIHFTCTEVPCAPFDVLHNKYTFDSLGLSKIFVAVFTNAFITSHRFPMHKSDTIKFFFVDPPMCPH